MPFEYVFRAMFERASCKTFSTLRMAFVDHKPEEAHRSVVSATSASPSRARKDDDDGDNADKRRRVATTAENGCVRVDATFVDCYLLGALFLLYEVRFFRQDKGLSTSEADLRI